MARCLLSNDVPRKDLAREAFGLADQKAKSVGRSDALLRMIEAHRSDIKKVMGAADLQQLRYNTVLVRLYVSAASVQTATWHQRTMSIRMGLASSEICQLLSQLGHCQELREVKCKMTYRLKQGR